MTYDAAEPTAIDRIRGRVLDTSNDSGLEYLPDETYESILTRHESEARAGAEIAGRIAALIAARPVALSAGDKSLRWSDKRAEYIKAVQAEYLAEAADADADAWYGSVVTVTADVMRDSPDMEATW